MYALMYECLNVCMYVCTVVCAFAGLKLLISTRMHKYVCKCVYICIYRQR